ncbi:MAG: alpha/beta hydrolase [Acidimicrobiia bacterium]
MVPRSGIGVIARLSRTLLALGITLAGCSGSSTTTTATPTATTNPVTTTSVVTPATTIPTTTTSTPTTVGTPPATFAQPPPADDVEVLVPDGAGPFPTAVLVHGGGWVIGSPAIMRSLAKFLTANGYLTVNTPYTLAGQNPGFPAAVNDVACAADYAAARSDGDGTVVLIGHSAGAHISALVALDQDTYGHDCPYPRVAPDRLIGLAGPYDVARLGPLMIPFFGGDPSEVPEAWKAGNPFNFVDENPGLDTLLMSGDEDALVDLTFASDFAAALEGAGKTVQVEVVEGARHDDMHDPAFVGELILAWLQR